MSAAPANPASDGGSMLIEAMVAVAVIALVMAVGFRAMGESAAKVRDANAGGRALLIAQSRLSSVGADIPLSSGETDGSEGGFQWRVRVEPYASDQSTTGELWRTRVDVWQGRARRASLVSLRLGRGA